MKRFLVMGLLALGVSAVLESTASAELPIGIGGRCRRIGRLEGYWLQPTRGPLYDYSSYFAALYPYFPGAQEYQWQPTMPGSFGTAVAVLPTAPPRPPAAVEVRIGERRTNPTPPPPPPTIPPRK